MLLLVLLWSCTVPSEKEREKLGAVDPDLLSRPSRVLVPFRFDKPHTHHFFEAKCENGKSGLKETEKELEFTFSIPEYDSCILRAYFKDVLTFSWKDEIYCEHLRDEEFRCTAIPKKK